MNKIFLFILLYWYSTSALEIFYENESIKIDSQQYIGNINSSSIFFDKTIKTTIKMLGSEKEMRSCKE